MGVGRAPPSLPRRISCHYEFITATRLRRAAIRDNVLIGLSPRERVSGTEGEGVRCRSAGCAPTANRGCREDFDGGARLVIARSGDNTAIKTLTIALIIYRVDATASWITDMGISSGRFVLKTSVVWLIPSYHGRGIVMGDDHVYSSFAVGHLRGRD